MLLVYTESNLEKFSWLHYTQHLIRAIVWAENLFNPPFVATLDNEDISNEGPQFIPQYHNIWSLSECAVVFEDGLKNLTAKVENFVKSDFRSGIYTNVRPWILLLLASMCALIF